MNILHRFKTTFTLAVVIAVFAGCSEDQSSLSIDNLPGKAQIVGKVTYSPRDTYDSYMANIESPMEAAVNKTVFVEVKNSSLGMDPMAQGYTTYTAVTDSKGEYEIEIPVSMMGTDIRVSANDFLGERLSYIYSFELYKYEKQMVEVVYISNPKYALGIQPNSLKVVDLQYEYRTRNYNSDFN